MTDHPDPRAPVSSDQDKASVHAALFGGPNPDPRRIGRFRITGRLGAGGMGEVLAGFDDELEREVAIKLLHPEIRIEHAQRLRTEAKALAKLSHPNVVQVYEVGIVDEQVFVAMEYIRGVTLQEWLRLEPRQVAPILDMFVAAGRGLAAAHAAGLVHRDFKPDNVLVGEDGRPRILDFGLARNDAPKNEQSDRAEVDPSSLSGELAVTEDTQLQSSVTATGAVLGTPAYMSPEQFRGKSTGAATDQFSFCVALWEALYGRRPFAGTNIRALSIQVCEGRTVEPESPRGSARLRRIVERGLAKEPEDRWPSMAPLLDTLLQVIEAPQRRRRRATLVGAGVLVAAATGWAATRTTEVATPVPAVAPPPCVPVAERMAGVWDAATRDELTARYDASPGGGPRWWAVERRLLDGWVADWTRIYETSCSATAEEGPARFALRQTCLDQRMIEIRTRVQLARSLPPDARVAADSNDYPPFALPLECDDEDILRAVTLYPTDAKERASVVDAMTDFRVAEGQASAAFAVGTPQEMQRTREGFMLAKATVEGTEFVPAIAEVRLREGNGWLMAGAKPEVGFPLLDEAIELAEQTRCEALGVFAGLRKLRYAAQHGAPVMGSDETERSFTRWDASLERVGSPAHVTVPLLVNRARHRLARGERDAMAEDLEQALAVNRQAYGEDSYLSKSGLLSVADVYEFAGDVDRAREVREELVGLIERLFGEDAMQLRLVLDRELTAQLRAGRTDDALRTARRLVAIAETDPGSGAADLVAAKVELGRVLMATGDYDEAARILEELGKHADDYIGVQADVWAFLQLVHMALAGEPNDAARAAAANPDIYEAAKQLAAVFGPLLAGGGSGPAEQALAAALAEPEWFAVSRGAALIQWGRLLEGQGQHERAAAAFASVLELEHPALDPGVASYQEVLEFAAHAGLRRARTAAGLPED